MLKSLAILACLVAVPDAVETKFEQVYPVPRLKEVFERTPERTRAVVLIHGLNIIPLKTAKAHQALFHDWQLPRSQLVQYLSKQSDVFAFAYAQNVALETICELPALPVALQRLRQMGYSEIVVVGHGAGGLIARQFVEDHPQAGVTRVIQVLAPNLGSSWVNVDFAAHKEQGAFVHSLTKSERQKSVQKRSDKPIPANVEFLCVIGASGPFGDGLVSLSSQWPEDLQLQGIPAVRIPATHFNVVRAARQTEKLAELAVRPVQRWSDAERTLQRRSLLSASGN